MINWQDGFLPVSWEEFRTLTFQLSQKVTNTQKTFQLIVAMARGGLTISQLLSDYLSLPIASFTIKSYKDLNQVQMPKITHELGSTLKNTRVLLVDDVADSGHTFNVGIKYLESLGALRNNITTASLHYKPHSTYKPDLFIVKTARWIVYPSELRETIITLTPKWRKAGLTEEEIKKRFSYFRFPQDQVEHFLHLLKRG